VSRSPRANVQESEDRSGRRHFAAHGRSSRWRRIARIRNRRRSSAFGGGCQLSAEARHAHEHRTPSAGQVAGRTTPGDRRRPSRLSKPRMDIWPGRTVPGVSGAVVLRASVSHPLERSGRDVGLGPGSDACDNGGPGGADLPLREPVGRRMGRSPGRDPVREHARVPYFRPTGDHGYPHYLLRAAHHVDLCRSVGIEWRESQGLAICPCSWWRTAHKILGRDSAVRIPGVSNKPANPPARRVSIQPPGRTRLAAGPMARDPARRHPSWIDRLCSVLRSIGESAHGLSGDPGNEPSVPGFKAAPHAAVDLLFAASGCSA
jgi:hypothetical protein